MIPTDINAFLVDEVCRVIADDSYSEGMALDSVWYALPYVFNRRLPDVQINFERQTELFFKIVHILMSDGRLRIAKKGEFLQGTIEQQIALFRSRFPSYEESQAEIGGVTTWFFVEDCPAGAVWIHQQDDGSECLDWT